MANGRLVRATDRATPKDLRAAKAELERLANDNNRLRRKVETAASARAESASTMKTALWAMADIATSLVAGAGSGFVEGRVGPENIEVMGIDGRALAGTALLGVGAMGCMLGGPEVALRPLAVAGNATLVTVLASMGRRSGEKRRAVVGALPQHPHPPYREVHLTAAPGVPQMPVHVTPPPPARRDAEDERFVRVRRRPKKGGRQALDDGDYDELLDAS